MSDVIATTCAFGLIGIAVLMCIWLIFGPVEDQPSETEPRKDAPEQAPNAAPTCWCVAFGLPATDCYCVRFED